MKIPNWIRRLALGAACGIIAGLVLGNLWILAGIGAVLGLLTDGEPL